MKHALLRTLLLACGCAGPAFAQDELPFWVPTHPGDTWIYQHESRGGTPNSKVERWRTEEAVVRSASVAEGTIVVRQIRILSGKPSVAQPKQQAWLIHGDCLYDLDSADWDARHPNQLNAAFSTKPPWTGGEHLRVFCFPLSEGKTWGKENGHEWHVADVNDQDPNSPDKGKTFHISPSSGAAVTDIWFERGVGIVRETAATESTQLMLFEPGPSVAIGSVPAPLGEVGVRYTYNSLSTSTSGESNQSGASVYGQYFFKGAGPQWSRRGLLGIVADFSGSSSGSGSLYTYLFAPRISTEWPRAHLVYYFEPIIGGAHVRVNGTALRESAASATRNSFAYGFGAGADLLFGPHCVVTLLHLETVSLDVPDVASGTSRWRSDSRISGGIGFRLGQR
jgi:hypothetical protein